MKKGTAKMSKLAVGICYFIGHLLRGTTAISKGPTAMAVGAVGYFKPCILLYIYPFYNYFFLWSRFERQALNFEACECDCTPSLASNHCEKCDFLHT